jgi:UDP-N-acetylglucosamine 2-epimerase (hydrolysing)
MRLAIIAGTRPEAIKQAPLILAARDEPGVEAVVMSSGQHREMLDSVWRFFGIKPDLDLGLMRPGQTLCDLTARALPALDEALARFAPDAVVVQGDTTTAMAAALVAFYRRVPVAHVEAGLRTDDLSAPFPEELNRRVADQIARWLLPPTARARDALLRDGLDRLGGKIVVTGNTVIDALLWTAARVEENPPESADLAAALSWKAAGSERSLVLVTGHRRENFGEPFREFCLGLRDLAQAHPEALLLYPVHLNPSVQGPVRELLASEPNIRLAPPADYPVFVALMKACDLVITDSGGAQEEAPALGKPVLVTRRSTERPEAVESGAALLVGPDRQAIFAEGHRLLSDPAARVAMSRGGSPYGDGRASRRCLDAILGRPVDEFVPARSTLSDCAVASSSTALHP